MPVYRNRNGRRLLVLSRARRIDGKNRVRVASHGAYRMLDSSLRQVESAMGISLHDLVHARAVDGVKPVVVDWGCGSGRAIEELGLATKGVARCLGVSDESFVEWNGRAGVEFIHASTGSWARFFKPGSIDVLFSHHGFEHVLSEKGAHEFAVRVFDAVKRLKPGGLFAITLKDVTADAAHKGMLAFLRLPKKFGYSSHFDPVLRVWHVFKAAR